MHVMCDALIEARQANAQLSAVQAKCTTLLEANRLLRAELEECVADRLRLLDITMYDEATDSTPAIPLMRAPYLRVERF